jgi:hypothetical protein
VKGWTEISELGNSVSVPVAIIAGEALLKTYSKARKIVICPHLLLAICKKHCDETMSLGCQRLAWVTSNLLWLDPLQLVQCYLCYSTGRRGNKGS